MTYITITYFAQITVPYAIKDRAVNIIDLSLIVQIIQARIQGGGAPPPLFQRHTKVVITTVLRLDLIMHLIYRLICLRMYLFTSKFCLVVVLPQNPQHRGPIQKPMASPHPVQIPGSATPE